MKSLVVEDSFVCRKLLTGLLSKHGHTDVAVNGLEALEAVKMALDENDHYDLICLDIQMPQMNGQDALTAIRRLEGSRGILRESGAKILMTTSNSDRGQVVAALKFCDGYLLKPIAQKMLEAELIKQGLLKN